LRKGELGFVITDFTDDTDYEVIAHELVKPGNLLYSGQNFRTPICGILDLRQRTNFGDPSPPFFVDQSLFLQCKYLMANCLIGWTSGLDRSVEVNILADFL
jgi:hypothetical protein